MARIPSPDELLELIRAAAVAWTRRDRIRVVVSVRSLDELEARRAWGDR